MKNEINLRARWGILLVGTVSMLFAGIIYAWSILKVPFAEELGFAPSALALNFTLTMCFFCLGGLLGSIRENAEPYHKQRSTADPHGA